MGKKEVFLISFVFMTAFVKSSPTLTDIGCKDYNGKPVDWFIAYKLPRIKSGDAVMKDGLKFYYLDANRPVWHISPIPISFAAQPIASTIKQVYGKKNIMHIMYNDETPAGAKSDTHGHTKGVVAFGAKSGFWLVHSVPKFPPAEEYVYPSSGTHFGQSFLCLTLGTKENLDKIVNQLLINYPFIYSWNVPESMSSPKLQDLLDGKRNKTKEGSLVELLSVAGQSFQSFAKSREYGKDLYSAWLAPWMRSSVLVETWRSALPTDCSKQYKVKDVRKISFGGKQEFKETRDHSKWAVGETQPWTCVGDINRMKAQEERSGGTVCLKHVDVNKSFKKIISQSDQCPKRRVYHFTRESGMEKL